MALPSTLLIGVSSVGTTALCLYLLVDAARRRGRFPQVTYRGKTPSQLSHQVAWLVALAGTYLLSFVGVLESDLVASTSRQPADSYTAVGLAQPLEPGDTVDLRRFVLPFHSQGVRVWRDPTQYQREEYEVVRVPWAFLLTAALYFVLVVRWRYGPADSDLGDRP